MQEDASEQRTMGVGSEETQGSAETIEYLTNTVTSLRERIIVLEGKDAELREVHRLFNESEKARNDLNQCLKETGEKMLSESKLTAAFKDNMTVKNKNLMSENRQLREKLQKIEGEKTLLESQMITLRNYIAILDLEVKTLKETVASEEDTAKLLKKINTLFEESKQKNAIVFFCYVCRQ